MTAMHPRADVRLEDLRWGELEVWATRALAGVLGTLDLQGPFEISVLGCDDATIAQLNTAFRGKATPTNVLSWPAQERGPETPGDRPELPDPRQPMDLELGDIAIAYDICAAEAAQHEKPFEAHVVHLLVHGILHLLGFDHQTDADAAVMEGLEVKILASMGIDDPYELKGAIK